MKEGWEYKKLKDIATFTRGLTYSKNDEAEISNNIVLRSNNVDLSTGKLNFDELKYLKSEFSIPEEKRVKKGSLLMCMSNGSKIHLGKVALINEDYPYAFGGFMALVTPNEELNPQFFHYSLSSPEYKEFIKKLSEGANINNIKVKELELFTIPIPPLSEQQSIVDYLDSAFAKIDAMKANAEKALNEAKTLFQASLKEMLEPKEGWEEKKLDDIGELKNGMNFNKNESGYNIHILGVGDFGNLFQIEDTDYLQRIALNSNPSEEYILKNEDIVFVRSNGNKNLVGRCVLIHVGDEPCFFSGFCIRFRKSTNEVDACYLTYFLKTEESRRKLVGNGANISNLNQKVLNEFVVSYPSIQEQQSIVETLDSLKSKVDRLQENYNKISQECDALKQAILRQVFE